MASLFWAFVNVETTCLLTQLFYISPTLAVTAPHKPIVSVSKASFPSLSPHSLLLASTMADKSSTNNRKPSRLQRRAPASIQISPVSNWNVAIPLLSPVEKTNRMSSSSKEESRRAAHTVVEPEKKPVVYKKWQHPADPFYYEPAPPFVCSGVEFRSWLEFLIIITSSFSSFWAYFWFEETRLDPCSYSMCCFFDYKSEIIDSNNMVIMFAMRYTNTTQWLYS